MYDHIGNLNVDSRRSRSRNGGHYYPYKSLSKAAAEPLLQNHYLSPPPLLLNAHRAPLNPPSGMSSNNKTGDRLSSRSLDTPPAPTFTVNRIRTDGRIRTPGRGHPEPHRRCRGSKNPRDFGYELD